LSQGTNLFAAFFRIKGPWDLDVIRTLTINPTKPTNPINSINSIHQSTQSTQSTNQLNQLNQLNPPINQSTNQPINSITKALFETFTLKRLFEYLKMIIFGEIFLQWW
jgi:hypothetical protein